MKKFFSILYFFCVLSNIYAQYTIPHKMEWWYHDRFGMFIHFGSYSYYGKGEWVMQIEKWSKDAYQTQITSQFNPHNFNAKAIVDVAKSTGMKYIVITAKHHEGFCMWKTNVAGFRDYTGNTVFDLYHYIGFERDILKELKDECDAQGIKFCLYYSILDWNHPSQTLHEYFSVMKNMEAKTDYVLQMKAQLRELITLYKPAVLWFDGDWCENVYPPTLENWWNKDDAINLYNYILSIDSTIIINERVKRELGLGDFMCPEQKIPDAPLERQWETCQTMNGTWGYDAKSYNAYNSAQSFIHELELIVSRDGNYLLNIDPLPDGSLNPNMLVILHEIGEWMRVYGESIYGCKRSPFLKQP
ncbi:MAG TPA: alpha-L-fucosidase, partial [Bacteroidales bacterium]|nr:alpha-L-fucosidase [Bacteroidales bacterium]